MLGSHSLDPAKGSLPLKGRRILITRDQRAGADTARRIRDLGGEPLHLPLIEIRPPRDPEPLDRALTALGRFDWIVFTSRNGVRFTLRRMRALGLPVTALGQCRVAAVGTGTAEALREQGVRVDLVPESFRWQALASALERRVSAGARVLLPAANRAKPELPQALRAAGIDVQTVTAYETVTRQGIGRALRALADAGGVDAVLLASDSAVEAFAAALAELGTGGLARLARRDADGAGPSAIPTAGAAAGARRPLIGCIGPNTAAVARATGLPVDVVPAQARMESLLRAIAAAL